MYTYDHRCQGGSSRAAGYARDVTHVDSWRDYTDDLRAFVAQVRACVCACVCV